MKELLMRNRNFAALFFGRMVTNMGDSLYYVAAMWLVFELGGSAFYTGLAGFLTLLPGTLQFLTGPVIDKLQIQKLLVWTQILQAILVLLIPISHYAGFLSVSFILVIMPVISAIEQFAYPGQSALLPRLIRKDQLVKGNSLFSFAYQGVDLAFNAIAGILVALVGAITLYMIDAVTFIIAAILFRLINVKGEKQVTGQNGTSVKEKAVSYKKDLAEGFGIVFRSKLAKFLLGSVVANFAIGSTYAVLPAFAELRGGSEAYGLYLAAISGGALIGALSASFFEKYSLGRLVIILFFLGGSCWMISGFIPSTTVSILFFGISWIPIGATNVIMGAAIQSVVPQHLMGRIFSVTASLGAAAMPFGSLLGGYLADAVNPVAVFAGSAAGVTFVSIVWLLDRALRTLPSSVDINPEELGLSTDVKLTS
ncbi:MFS transporter [Rossellomorea vietnamensis]|uniref:MFS transporter n=1 Tax=Rossellomorea vietnamensis TaxID=218284 RepID=UPI003CE6F675